MSEQKHTATPYSARFDDAITLRDSQDNQLAIFTHIQTKTGGRRNANEVEQTAKFVVRACNSHQKTIDALKLSRTALEHDAPSDCWATGPLTGDPIEDLVVCPGCRALHHIDIALSAAGAA